MNQLRIRRKASANQVRVTVLDNSRGFLSKIRYKSHLHLLGHYFQNKCSSESCCCTCSTFGVPKPTVDSVKKTASKKIRRGDTDLLLFSLLGWKKLLDKIYQNHHQLVDHQSQTVLMNLPLLFHFWSLCICMWRGSYSEGGEGCHRFLLP